MFTPEVMAVGPDCREGKHRACDGRGFDPVGDRIIRCSCDCHEVVPESHVSGREDEQ